MATVDGGKIQQQRRRLRLRRHLQDGTGTFGGQQDDAGALISQSTSTSTGTTTSSNGGGSPFDDTGKDVAIILLSFLAVILLILVLVRWWLYPSGRLLCPRSSPPGGQPQTVSSDDHRISARGQFMQQQQQDEDLELSRVAKLSKLKRKERRLVLEKLFESTTFIFNEQDGAGNDKKTEQDATNNATSNESETAADDSTSSREDTVYCHSHKDENTNAEGEDVERGAAAPTVGNFKDNVVAQDSSAAAALDERGNQHHHHNQHDDHDNTLCCSICLTEYETGDSVMTGRQCKHVFHSDCFLLWAVKRDHCPYCRKELFTAPHEFRLAALQVLGDERVEQIEGLEETEQEQRRTPDAATALAPAADAVAPTEEPRAEHNIALEADTVDAVAEANIGNGENGASNN